ncbi:MAG: DUF1549 domain-containing protein [Bryobacteraceae bacterium]
MLVRLTLLVYFVTVQASADEKTDFFERDVRPLLVSRCHSCHGPKASFAGLRLDTAAGVLSVKDKLLPTLRGAAGLKRMPPTGPLPAREIATLERWVAIGAPWPADGAATGGFHLAERRGEHWAWQPIRAVPWPAGRLKSIAPPADSATLLRRITFDLTGLPPTPDEIRDFAEHGSYERVVDGLLASPRFGERMARRWMDVIRYSESHGSEGDPDTPHSWRYRDYLIRAFNRDVPYDQLIREHLAGDLLAEPRIDSGEQINESRLALAHWRMVEHGFQPVDPWEDRVKWTDNQVDVFAKAFQGLTISCARCHDHKFDAISQKDYYALFGIFASARPTQAAIDSPQVLNLHIERLAALKAQIRADFARKWLTELPGLLERLPLTVRNAASLDWMNSLFPLSASDGELRDWLTKARKELTSRSEFNQKNTGRRWKLAEHYGQWPRQGVGAPAQASPAGDFSVLPDGATVIGGIYPGGVYSHLLSSKHGAVITSPRFQVDSDSISLRFLGGNFSYAQLIVENYAVPRGGIFNARTSAKSDEMGWIRWDTSFWKGFTAYIEFSTLNEATLVVPDDQDNRLNRRPPSRHTGRSWWGAQDIVFQPNQLPLKEETTPVNFVLDSAPTTVDAYAQHVERQLATAIDAFASGHMSDDQAAFLDSFVRQGVLSNRPSPLVDEYRRLENEIAVPRRAPGIIEEAGPDHPLLLRGDHKRPGDPVPRRFLTALDGRPYRDPKSMRLALAGDLTSPNNPLTARVIVNRLYQYLFREGIVATPDNFGKLGAAPKDLLLLDGLATQFVADGWSIKKMLRRLSLSPAYRSRDLPARRLEAEEIRDAILAAAGQLDLTMYGKSVPVHYAHETGSTKGDRPKGPLDGLNRRSVYLEIRRNATNPFLEVFDVYKPTSTRGQRDVTNVPAQSLALMNSPFVIQLSEKWAATLGKSTDRIDQLYLRALGRVPTAHERDRAESFAAEAKSLVPLVHAIFNLKEFLYVR